MDWPNEETWLAEVGDFDLGSVEYCWRVWTIQCGKLLVPSGRLAACDPFAGMSAGGNAYVDIPPGTYPVSLTLADVSEYQNRRNVREAYLTLRISPGTGVIRRVLPLKGAGYEFEHHQLGNYMGFGVDAGTACFVDDESSLRCMPEETRRYELFENGTLDTWSRLMDSSDHIRPGVANIELPLATNGENMILVHSGWGDGCYPLVGLFDENERLLAVHIDFGVIRQHGNA